ncbi:MAG: tRNA uridine-5-carboxymethylaminomethyl(34) synthesis GTPase MnmE [Clostridia bacterium]|nr:tRNA uridine-5-carboxymethylaminomethyl(34) synthesis GTPase MnmE [Clostridia bacterium]
MAIDTTIAAISTPPGTGAVSMVRVSGPDAFTICDRIFKKKKPFSFCEAEKNTVHYGRITELESGVVLDEVVAAVYRAPHSFTGEDTVEIFCHGGVTVTRRVLMEIIRAGASQAEAGEFSKRAFLNGKLDLSQAEAIIELINARTYAAETLAARSLSGGAGQTIKDIRAGLIDVLSHILAYIDFPDEDVEYIDEDEVLRLIRDAQSRIEKLISTYKSGRAITEGIDCAIVGRTNAGKSSVMNRLTGEETSIVTDIEGTTRDVVSKSVSVGRAVLNLLDTAGIREARDAVERIGVERALSALDRAQLVLYVADTSDPRGADDEIIGRIKDKPVIVVLNKSDLSPAAPEDEYAALGDVVRISAKTGEGLSQLKQKIEDMFIDRGLDPARDDIITAERHFERLTRASEALSEATQGLAAGMTFDVVSIDIQAAADALGDVTGQSAADEVIDRIFERFCIGK